MSHRRGGNGEIWYGAWFFLQLPYDSNLVVAKKGGQIFLGASGADLLLIDLRDRKTVARFPLPPKKRWQAATGRVLTKEDIQVDGDPESPSTVKIEDRPPKSRSIWTIWKLWQTKVDFDDSFSRSTGGGSESFCEIFMDGVCCDLQEVCWKTKQGRQMQKMRTWAVALAYYLILPGFTTQKFGKISNFNIGTLSSS